MSGISEPLARSPGGRRRWLARLEGGFWLTRPQSLFSQAPIALAAWSIGCGGLDATAAGDALLLVVFLMAVQGAMFVVNDIVDAERDTFTAPYMPIPSGVVSRNEAILELALLGVVIVGSVVAIARDLFGVLCVAATLPVALVVMKLYGMTKSAHLSPLFGSTTFSCPALWAWLLAGREDGSLFAIVFAIAALHGIHANLRAQLRDIEGDPRAGNITLAVRVGARRTLWLAAFVRFLELCGIFAACVTQGATAGLLWLLAALVLFATGMARARSIHATDRSRIEQTEALSIWMYGSFLAEISVLGAFHPVAALPLAIVMFVWFRLVRRIYYERVVGGHLAAQQSG